MYRTPRIEQLVPICFSCLLIVTGCSDRPDALQMRVISAQPHVDASEPMRFIVEFHSDERVCLSRHRNVAVEIRDVQTNEIAFHPRLVGFCGMPGLTLLPLLPVIIPARLLDTADVGSRFLVLHPGETARNELILGGDDHFLVWFESSHTSPPSARPTQARWKPGQYRIVVTLDNGGYPPPAPIFWKPYSHEVKAEAIVRVVDRSAPMAKVPTPTKLGAN